MHHKTIFATLMSVALSFSTWACSNHSNGPGTPMDIQDPNGNSDHLPAMSWKLAWSAKCGDRKPETCLGAYGFQLNSNGDYQIGPGPRGQTLTGHIKDSELAPFVSSVNNALRAANPTLAASTPNCPTDRNSPYLERVEIQSGLTSRTVNWNEADQPCSTTLSSDQAERIREQIKALAKDHYPDEFPNACIDAGLTLDELHVSVRSCEQDSDCSLIDREYVPIDQENLSGELTVDDCTFIPPIIVANAFHVVTNQRKLLLSRELAKKVCGEHLQRKNCISERTLDAASAHAVCQQNTCRVTE